MKRKIVLAVVGGMVLLGLLGAAGIGGVYIYRAKQTQGWLVLAENAFARGDWGAAKRHFEWYLPRRPRDVSSLRKYAEACGQITEDRRGALRSIVMAYHQILRCEPDNTDIQRKLLELYEKMGAWAELESFVGELFERRPEDPMVRYYRALALDRLGRGKEAVAAYRALLPDTQYLSVYGNLARLLRDQGLAEEARAMLDEGLARRPNDVEMRLERHYFFVESKDLTRASDELEEAARLAGTDSRVVLAQLRWAITRKDWPAAVSYGESIPTNTPQKVEAYLPLTQAYLRTAGSQKAIALLEQADPLHLADDPRLFVTLADLQISAGRFEDAHRTAETFAKVFPTQRVFLGYLKGRELLAKGQAEAAARELAMVLEQQPSFGPAQYHLAVAYSQSGQRDLAQNTLESYLRRYPEDERARQLLAKDFASARSVGEVEAEALTVLKNPNAEAETLTLSAESLLEASLRTGEPGAHADTIRKLLERVIGKEPASPRAHVGLVNMALAIGDVAGARRALQRAISSGVPEETLYQMCAMVSLAEGDADTARAFCRKDLGRADAEPESAVSWAKMFSNRGRHDIAMGVLSEAIASSESPARGRLEMERIALQLRSGDAEGALEALRRTQDFTSQDGVRRGDIASLKAELARELFQREDKQADAARLLEEARELDADNPAVLSVDGQLLLRKGRAGWDEAGVLFERVLRRSSDDLYALVGLAQIASAHGEASRALEYMERAARSHPEIGAVQLERARLQVQLNRFEEAQSTLKRVLARNATDIQALSLLATSFLAAGKIKDAENTLVKLEHASGDKPEARKAAAALRAKLLAAQGASGEAAAALRAQHEADPDDFSIVQALARVLGAAGREDEAAGLVRAYAERHGTSAEAWVLLARLLLESKAGVGIGDASTALTRALVADPEYLPALKGMIELQVRLGRRVDGLALCDRYLARAPTDGEVLRQKAVLLAQDEAELDKALETIERAMAVDQRSEPRLVRVFIFLAKGRYRDALEDLLLVAREQGEPSAELDAALAEAYLGTGQVELARKHFQTAKKKASMGARADARRMERLSARLGSQGDGT